MSRWYQKIGPGTLIAAAFIGPGTVTICMLAGVKHGFDLLWAMVFSIVATIVLQEMAARIGLVTNKGLAEIIRNETTKPLLKFISAALILSAIVIGNAAYEAGNISGAILGVEAMHVDLNMNGFNLSSLLIGCIAFVLLYIGKYKIIERSLIFLVLILSLTFFIAAIATKPSIIEILKGIFIPSFPDDGTLTVMGIIGTTVVPYNLFLHASLVKEKWGGSAHLSDVRRDLYISIGLGGLVSIMIIIAASALHESGLSIVNALDMAVSLENVLGPAARYVIGLGLFAAGITSAITAPLAAAYVCTELLGLNNNLKSNAFRIIWMSILAIGVVFSSIGLKPIEVIKYAQLTNGILLPVIAGFLLWIVNKRSVMTHHRNSNWQNALGLLILAITIALGLKSILTVAAFI
ncbi:MAG: Nramp family divalent metal transporter [Saprospiraceae bacterium]|nr:Nramp family divalent metal transporter [Saprospiraceae bacterium]